VNVLAVINPRARASDPAIYEYLGALGDLGAETTLRFLRGDEPPTPSCSMPPDSTPWRR